MLIVTDEMRSMIASLVIATADDCRPCSFCLCCSDDGPLIAADIVGPEYALALCDFAHESLGCGWIETAHQAFQTGDFVMADFYDGIEQRCLANISELDTLGE